MLSTKDTSRHWVVASMTRGARRVATVLSCLTLAVVLVVAGTLYEVESNPVASKSPLETLTYTQSTPTSDGVELIVDDAVPLAASPHQQPAFPTALLVSATLAVIGGFFALRIHQVDASISSMYRTIR